jgi:dTDP-D-glucose 4,6-dehydratase
VTKHILITGGAGFAGHHLVEHVLKNTEWFITVWDKLTYASHGFDRLRDIGVMDEKRVQILTVDFTLPISTGIIQETCKPDFIIHMGAETHVDNSIKDPYPFIMSNVVGTYHVLEYALGVANLEKFVYFSTDEVFGTAPPGVFYKEWDNYNSRNPYAATKAGGEELVLSYATTYELPVLVTHCHDEATNAFTPDGIKSVYDLSIGDKVWALSGDKLVKTEILEIVNRPYQGEMIGLFSGKYDQLVTPNHRVMISRSVGKPRRWQPWEMVKADSLFDVKGRLRIPVMGEWNCAQPDIVEIPQTGHYNETPIINPVIPINIMQLFGWFISEGSTSKSTVSIASHDKNHRMEIMYVADSLGLTYREYDTRVEVYSTSLVRYLTDQCGRGAANKHIPKWALDYPPDYLEILFDTLIKGDGTYRYDKRQALYYTKSITLAEQVAELGIKVGYAARISERYTWNPKKTRKGLSYIVRLRNPAGTLERQHVRKEYYEGNVWCLRTKEGNFFIERNGVISCSGNTMNLYGERQHPEKFIPKIVNCVLDGSTIPIHADKTKTQAGQRHYLHCRNMSDALLHLLQVGYIDTLGAHLSNRAKVNIVGEREVNNYELALWVSKIVGKPLHFEMVDYHTSRPGHDLRYALDGSFLKDLGWIPPVDFETSLEKTVRWMLDNPRWLSGMKG